MVPGPLDPFYALSGADHGNDTGVQFAGVDRIGDVLNGSAAAGDQRGDTQWTGAGLLMMLLGHNLVTIHDDEHPAKPDITDRIGHQANYAPGTIADRGVASW